jgi:hypothetical protein
MMSARRLLVYYQLVAGCGTPGAERIGHWSSTKNTGSLKLAREELWKLWEEEKKIAKRGDHAKWFSRLEVAGMTVGTPSSAGRAAATATIPVVRPGGSAGLRRMGHLLVRQPQCVILVGVS